RASFRSCSSTSFGRIAHHARKKVRGEGRQPVATVASSVNSVSIVSSSLLPRLGVYTCDYWFRGAKRVSHPAKSAEVSSARLLVRRNGYDAGQVTFFVAGETSSRLHVRR